MAKQVIPEGEVEGNDPLTREDVIVDRVTKNIEEMLDKKLATIIKPVTDLSDKFDAAAKRMDSLEQRVSDLEDVSVGNAPRMDCMEKSLKKALERLDNYENQRRRQNISIIGLEEGTEGRDPAAFFEEWIPAILEMRVKRVKIDKAIRMGLQTGRSGRDGSRAVIVTVHDYADKQRILYAAGIKEEWKWTAK
ncbi:hypothetical protein WMY93_008759 [Mugilogobius chulae]|uniref:Uncharacterized protein n=1 Tax=Mugilogobius chulae TaxID=88201 RepID=A0AAW0PCZ2_9GOBI